MVASGPFRGRYGATPFLAWGSVALASGMFVARALIAPANAAVAAASQPSLDETIWMLSWFGFGIVGAVIVSRRPVQRLGWLMCGITLGVYLMLFLAEYAIRGLVLVPGSLPFALAAGWTNKWIFVPVLGCVLSLILLFPSGRADDRLGRWLLRGTIAFCAAMVVLLALEPRPIRGDLDVMNPLAVHDPLVGITTYAVGYALVAVAGLTALRTVSRFRRSRGSERQQFRWFALAVVAFPVLFVATIVLEGFLGEGEGFDPVVFAFFFGMNGIAAAIGIAVTRHGLYEIDRVVSRTVAYLGVTAILVALYASGVVGVGGLLRRYTGGVSNDLLVAASTLAVAAAFGPLLRRVQSVVDRRFNRARYDATRTVDDFSQRLRDELDPDALRRELRTAVVDVLQPTHADVWLKPLKAVR